MLFTSLPNPSEGFNTVWVPVTVVLMSSSCSSRLISHMACAAQMISSKFLSAEQSTHNKLWVNKVLCQESVKPR